MNALQLADAIDALAVNPKGGKMAAIAYRRCAHLIREKLCRPCPYCGDGKHTGLPNNACENCMNTGYLLPTYYAEGRCQKCGQLTRGEEAWIDGQYWCHSCADKAP